MAMIRATVVRAQVPRTRSSRSEAASPTANFGFKRGTRIMDLLVSLRFRSSHESVPRYLANFGIGTLVLTAAFAAALTPVTCLGQDSKQLPSTAAKAAP